MLCVLPLGVKFIGWDLRSRLYRESTPEYNGSRDAMYTDKSKFTTYRQPGTLGTKGNTVRSWHYVVSGGSSEYLHSAFHCFSARGSLGPNQTVHSYW